jgi:hypothetical protein
MNSLGSACFGWLMKISHNFCTRKRVSRRGAVFLDLVARMKIHELMLVNNRKHKLQRAPLVAA